MPAATSPQRQDGAAAPDDLDNLLDYDDDANDFWKDIPNRDNANGAPEAPKDMDEEVKMTKKRKPNPKLDQDR